MKWEFKPNMGLQIHTFTHYILLPQQRKGWKFHWEIGWGLGWLIPSNILNRERGYQLLTNSWDMLRQAGGCFLHLAQ